MNQRLADQLTFGSFFLISPHVHVSLKFLVHMSLDTDAPCKEVKVSKVCPPGVSCHFVYISCVVIWHVVSSGQNRTDRPVSHVGTILSFAHILVTVSRCFVTVGAQFVANTANRIPFLPRTLLDRESQRVSLYVAITATSSREHILV